MKRIIINIVFIFSALISVVSVQAQRNQKGKPISLQKGVKFDADSKNESSKLNSKKYKLPLIDNDQAKLKADSITRARCSDCRTSAYGQGVKGRIDLKKEAEKNRLGDSLNIWLMSVESSTAFGMQFYFEDYKLPEGAKLFIYNDHSQILGAFTDQNNPKKDDGFIAFGTQWIQGNLIHIEYQEPVKPEFKGEIAVQNIIHIFTNVFDKSGPYASGNPGSCQINVSCDNGDDWKNEITSVGLILQLDNSGDVAYTSSGSLINSTSNSVGKRPLFLTARHIAPQISTWQNQYNPTTYVFLFNHEATSCNDSGSNAQEYQYSDYAVYGSDLIAGHGGTPPSADYLLLELDESMYWFKERELSFNGWSKSSNQTGSLFAGIHHPYGDVKKISFASAVHSSYYDNSNTNINGDHWSLQWSLGVTSPGSSGSPLFDENHRIIGQLHGGSSTCNNQSGYDYYGKFYTAFTTDSNFRDALDPVNSGAITVDSYTPHIDDNPFLDGCVADSEVEFNKIGTEGFFLNSENIDASCQNSVVYMSANDRLLLNAKGSKVWDLSYPEKSKFDMFPGSGNCTDDGSAYYCGPYGGVWTCTCYWAKIFVELKQYDYYMDMASESTLVSDWVSIGEDHLSSENGLGEYQWGSCAVTRLYVKSFYLDSYLPVSLQANKVYRLKLKTERTNSVQERVVWIDTHYSGLNLSGTISDDNVASKDVTLQNSVLSNGSKVYFGQTFKLQGSNSIQPNTEINRMDISDNCLILE